MTAQYRALPSIDILPGEYRWRLVTTLQVLLVLALVAGVALGYVLYQNRLVAQEQMTTLRENLSRARAATVELAPQVQQGDAVRQEIAGLKAELAKVQRAQTRLQGQRVDWAGLMEPLFVSPPQGIKLAAVDKGPQSVTVEGTAPSYPVLTQYYHQLVAAPGVAQVAIDETRVEEDKTGGKHLAFALSVRLRGK